MTMTVPNLQNDENFSRTTNSHKEKWTYDIPRVYDHRLVARVAHHTDANLEQVICPIPVFGVFREFNTFSESFDGLEKHGLALETT
jgi:hypothetical protein